MYVKSLWRHRAAVGPSMLGLMLGSFLMSAATAGTVPSLTLAEAVRLAVRRAPQVQAGHALQEAARADLDRAGRWPDPRLVFGIQNLVVQGAGAFSPAADSMTTRTVGFSQEIPSGATLAAERAGARAELAAADASTEQARIDSRRAAAAAWVALWAAERARTQLEALRTQDALAVTATRARLAGGAGSATDVLAAQAVKAELENRLDAADAAVTAARAALARWIGSEPAATPLADPPDFAHLPTTAVHLLQSTDAQAPLLAWASRVDAAEAALQRARASKHPAWNVDLNYGARAPGLPAMTTLMVGVRLPLFAAHREDQDILARRADLEAVRAQHEDARRAQVEAVQRGLAYWQGQKRQVRRYRDTLLALAADRSATALAAYRGGASLQPWLEAQRADLDTRLSYAQTLGDWGRAWVALAYLLPESNP